MTLYAYLQNHLSLLLIWTGLLSACVGSFLNVVIYRFPLILKREWRKECHEFLKLPAEPKPSQTFNLALPRSTCPHCHHTIRLYHNIPLLSYLLLRGKCADCKAPIAKRYFFVEALTVLFSLFIIFFLGLSAKSLLVLLVSYFLIAMTFIDYDEQLLPDELTLTLMWIGLLTSLSYLFVSPEQAIIGAASGYLSLYLLAKGYLWITKREGMGHGDFKLTAAFGAFLGWQALPLMLCLAALLGSLVGGGMILLHRGGRHTPIPFGPFLAISGWIFLLWGQEIQHLYIGWVSQ